MAAMKSLSAMLSEYRRVLLAPRAERRFARRASAELLELYRQQRREHPEMGNRELYKSIVAQRLGPQTVRSEELVRRAEESFTDWPVERDLRFRHVAHYLIFYEYTLLDPARKGTLTNMGTVVAKLVPEDI
jgi:hypothetical protein